MPSYVSKNIYPQRHTSVFFTLTLWISEQFAPARPFFSSQLTRFSYSKLRLIVNHQIIYLWKEFFLSFSRVSLIPKIEACFKCKIVAVFFLLFLLFPFFFFNKIPIFIVSEIHDSSFAWYIWIYRMIYFRLSKHVFCFSYFIPWTRFF